MRIGESAPEDGTITTKQEGRNEERQSIIQSNEC